MPNISNIPVPQYLANQPYYYTYDNLPIEALKQRDDMINTQVDLNTIELLNSMGDTGSLANRLNQSLDQSGNLKTNNIDNALHNIGAHEDATFTVSGGELSAYQVNYPGIVNPVPFVRMLDAERDKIIGIAEGATNITLGFNLPSTIVFDNGPILIENSSTIVWASTGGQNVRADVSIALSNPHQHYNNIIPVSYNLTPDYQNYRTNSSSILYSEGSLKVYINGVRIFPNITVKYPGIDPSSAWISNRFSENVNFLQFSLLNAITSSDIIVVDFERYLG